MGNLRGHTQPLSMEDKWFGGRRNGGHTEAPGMREDVGGLQRVPEIEEMRGWCTGSLWGRMDGAPGKCNEFGP